MSEIKVMMFGASRSGKTSILASMYDKRTEVNEYGFTLRDRTNEKGEQDSLQDSVIGMKNLLEYGGKCPRMGALTGTRGVFYYTLELGYSLYEDINPTTLTFIDVPGEYFNEKHKEYDLVCDLAKECQILIVAVDTPALLLANAKGDNGWVYEINCTEPLKDAVQNLGINCRKGGNEIPLRMIVFVPIKCERWLHDKKSEEYKDSIRSQIEKVYEASIETSKDKKFRTKVMAMPLETIGGLEFDHHTPENRMRILKYAENTNFKSPEDNKWWEDYAIFSEKDEKERYASRCELDGDDDSVVTLAKTGRDYQLKEGDELIKVEEMSAYPYCYRKNRPIPFAWFRPIGPYDPKNCNQLFLEIVKFMVQQMADEGGKNVNKLIDENIDNNFWVWLFENLLKQKGFFDDKRQLQAMCKAIKKMKEENKLNECLEIHNNIDYEGSELEIK